MKRLLLGLVFVVWGGYASGAEVPFEGAAQPADVLVAVERFADDLEAVRLFMGKPSLRLNRFRVEFAAPRHVYYQARSLFWKANRLGQEVAGLTKQSPPAAPSGEVLPDHVLRTVMLAQDQLDLVAAELGLQLTPSAPRRDPRAEPKDVFEAMVQAVRQVNQMIEDPFRPADVYEQLASASTYLAGVLVRAGDEGYPEVPFVPNKAPVDVYDKLVDCLVVNQRIGEALGLPVLKVRARALRRDRSILSDNYDIATILVSDTAYWTELLAYDDDVFETGDSLRHVFPAHVFAKASSVERQLAAIERHIKAGTIERAPE